MTAKKPTKKATPKKRAAAKKTAPEATHPAAPQQAHPGDHPDVAHAVNIGKVFASQADRAQDIAERKRELEADPSYSLEEGAVTADQADAIARQQYHDWGTVFTRARTALGEHGIQHDAPGHGESVPLGERIRRDHQSLIDAMPKRK